LDLSYARGRIKEIGKRAAGQLEIWPKRGFGISKSFSIFPGLIQNQN
jgi:hypothetical protein